MTGLHDTLIEADFQVGSDAEIGNFQMRCRKESLAAIEREVREAHLRHQTDFESDYAADTPFPE